MSGFVIDPAIAAITHSIAEIDGIHYRLHENSQVMWFILLPETTETEIFDLFPVQQQTVHEASSALGRFILAQFSCDKINIASIGNVVPQLHIHVIGRRRDDVYWPYVVWNQPYQQTWANHQVTEIRQQFETMISVRDC